MPQREYVPTDTVCQTGGCGHPLSKHEDTDEIDVVNLKTRVHPCLYIDRDNGTFAVCGCSDFTPPEPVRSQPQAIPLSAGLTETPMHTLVVKEDIGVHEPYMKSVTLQLWHDGRVTWTDFTE